jgi:lysozyme
MNSDTLIYAAMAVMLGLIAAAWARPAQVIDTGDGTPWDPANELDQQTTFAEDALIAVTPSTYTGNSTDAYTASANVSAFLDLIAYAEGTLNERGYQTQFGYRYFTSFADHPRQYFDYTDQAGRTFKTSASGRYQIIVKTWDALKAKLGLQDFSPASQDAAAVELIRQRGALNDVKAGRIADAVTKCAPVWASLPGAGYNQPERQLSSLLTTYTAQGGTLA